jgi:hypothetical protein
MNSAHKNSHQENVKQVINSTLQHKSQAYCYPCYYQQIVSKISPLLCPISFPIRVATLGSKESSHAGTPFSANTTVSDDDSVSTTPSTNDLLTLAERAAQLMVSSFQ